MVNFPYGDRIPAVIKDYMSGWNDVIGDGNCGFRCVAEVFHGGQEHWPIARRSILNELRAHPSVYRQVYFDDYDRALERVRWGGGRCGEEHQMEIVADLFPIANFYQCTVMCFTMSLDGRNPQLSVTVFPWHVDNNFAAPPMELTIAHLGQYRHYILLDLEAGFPVPPICPLWKTIVEPMAVDWALRYNSRLNEWDRETGRQQDPQNVNLSDDD